MTISGKIAIAGVYEHPTRFAPDKTDSLIMAECARGALEDAGLSLSDVDGLFSAGISMGPMGVVQLAEYLDIKPRHLDSTNIGGSSFVAHVSHAAAAIHAGLVVMMPFLLIIGQPQVPCLLSVHVGGHKKAQCRIAARRPKPAHLSLHCSYQDLRMHRSYTMDSDLLSGFAHITKS